MTEPEDFLTRWSRKKREANADAANEAKREKSAPDGDVEERDTQAIPAKSGELKPDNPFDLSKLPSLDSIGPATDIRSFLQPGVPEALSRAALRRAWSADPAIRDFVGLSENSWDFSSGDGMHGFGALDSEDAKRLIARLLGAADGEKDEVSPDADAKEASNELEQIHGEAREPGSTGVGHIEAEAGAASVADPGAIPADTELDTRFAAPQKEQAEPVRALTPARRNHGRALPQ